LRGRLSEQCRVGTGAFERRNFSRDMARFPRLVEKILHRTRPHLVVQPRHVLSDKDTMVPKCALASENPGTFTTFTRFRKWNIW
jgi:hypothetical protein